MIHPRDRWLAGAAPTSFFGALLACFSPVLFAQTPDTASLRGQVINQSRSAIVGAQITATNTLNKIERSAQTDGSGYFSLEGLPIAGGWSVTASKSGFVEARSGDLILQGGTGA
jgi:hypothetical protein